jgi:hypothetical protein
LNPAPAAPGAVINSTYTAVKTPVTISGIDNSRLQQLSSHLNGTQFNDIEFYSRIGGAPGAPPANASPNLSAGDMIGVAFATGDVVNIMGFGTVTQVYGDKFVAFGHGMSREGQVSLPVYRAVVDGLVPSLEATFKSVSAYGNPIGTVTKDLRAGIAGELGKLPPMIPVTVTYQPVNSPQPIQTHHKVAYGQEWAIPIVAATTLDAIRSEISPGTIEANVAISFKETKNVYTESFRSISPDPYESVLGNMGVIVESFTNILANGAGRATIDEINISLIDIPNILHTEIIDIHVIGEVEQGEEATFVVEMLPHWSAAGRNHKMYREVKLQIPENFITGPASLSIAAVTEYGFNPFSNPFAPPPENLDQLIGQLKDGQFDKGLVLVTLATLQEEPEEIDPVLEAFFEEFFEALFADLFDTAPEDGELPSENGEVTDEEVAAEDGETPEDGEIIEVIDEEELMEDLAPTPRPIPITGTALLVNRFIVTGDTDVEVEILPAAVEVETEAGAEVE